MTRQVLRLLPQLRSRLHGGSVARNTAAISQLFQTRGFADDASLMKTPLYDFHVENGGDQSSSLDLGVLGLDRKKFIS